MTDVGEAGTAPAQSGTFVCVAGPSGAGKDTLIRFARAALADDENFVFPRRLVTRPTSALEEHATLSPAQFEAGVREGRFALHWRAHGLGYGVERSILAASAAGRMVVCNVSRDSIDAARRIFAYVKVVYVTAPESLLAARLAARGREAQADLAERLRRNAAYLDQGCADLTIVNSGRPEDAAGELTHFLIALRSSQGGLDETGSIISKRP